MLENLCVFPEAFTQRFSCAPVRDKLQWLIACVMPSSYFSELLFRKEKKKKKKVILLIDPQLISNFLLILLTPYESPMLSLFLISTSLLLQ